MGVVEIKGGLGGLKSQSPLTTYTIFLAGQYDTVVKHKKWLGCKSFRLKRGSECCVNRYHRHSVFERGNMRGESSSLK